MRGMSRISKLVNLFAKPSELTRKIIKPWASDCLLILTDIDRSFPAVAQDTSARIGLQGKFFPKRLSGRV